LSFNIPELILESIIRDGLANIKADLTIIDDLFGYLTRPYASQKYGSSEIQKIKDLVTSTEIPVVYSFHESDAKSPCFSIHIGDDDEDRTRDHLDDYYAEETITLSPSQIAALTLIPNILPTAYDSRSGQLLIPNSVDLTLAYAGLVFVDGSDVEHPIFGGIDNTTGNKMFFIEKNGNPDMVNPGLIRTPITYEVFEVRGVTQAIKLMVGVHTKNSLTTKYLYTILKYIILSRKKDLIKRGIYVARLSGSDFSRDIQFQGDQVFTRFLTVTGKVDDTWKSYQVDLIDQVIVDVEAQALPENLDQSD
jgi:hypothetical protein